MALIESHTSDGKRLLHRDHNAANFLWWEIVKRGKIILSRKTTVFNSTFLKK